MQLESVRSLKMELQMEGIGSEVAAQGSLPEGALRNRSALPEYRPLAPLSLGISRQDEDFRLAVRVLTAFPGVQQEIDRVAARAGGEVDVRVVGPVSKQTLWTQSRMRPLLLGCSIGHVDITAGTLGVVVRRDPDGTNLLLSNNHVFANEDLASIGDDILQQGDFDGGEPPGDVCAQLESAIPLRWTGNLVDAALALLSEDVGVDTETLTGLGRLAGVRNQPLLGDERVFKVGRTTGITEGYVSAVEVDRLPVGFDRGTLVFDEQLEITSLPGENPFSLGGDSGSLVVDEDLRAVGLLFAGNDSDTTYVNPITTVLEELGVRLVVGDQVV